MLSMTHDELDHRLRASLDGVGVVGDRFRQDLLHDLKAKVVLRDARDAVDVVGGPGTGRKTVASAVHMAARDVLGRDDARVDVDCAALTAGGGLLAGLDDALESAAGGTLVLDRFDRLGSDQRGLVEDRIDRWSGDALVVYLRDEDSPQRRGGSPGTRIRLKPLHEREEDLWGLIAHFFDATSREVDLGACAGFSRQALADIAQVAGETHLASVRRLREIVRDLVFEALAVGPLPRKLTSDHVRPYLEGSLGQTADARDARDRALVESQMAHAFDDTLLERLGETHGVSEEVLAQQAQIIAQVIEGIDDVPRSYRNIMDRTDDVMRAALWLLSGAETQASFRRFFGDERFMRPTKSVAWAFYNRVFKRDV